MLSRLIGLVARLAVGKHLVAGLALVHDKLDGHRSEIAVGLLAIVHGLKLASIIPADVADSIEQSLMTIIPVVLADKVSKAKKLIDQATPKP